MRKKIEVNKTHAFQHGFFSIFRHFGLRKPFQNRRFFATFSKTSILCKSLQNTGCAHKNQGSNSKKTRKFCQKIDPETHSKNASQKIAQKSICASILASQPLPKSSQNRPGTRKNAVLDEACFATLCNPPGNRRKVSGAVVCKASIRPGI